MRRVSRLGVVSFAFVGVALVSVSLSACGSTDEESLGKQASELGADGGDAEAGVCRDVTLVATRTSSGAVDASQRLVPSMTFRLPASVDVVDGLHGSHNIDFGYVLGGTSVTCRYKGRDGTLPLSTCSNGAVAGQAVTADQVTLAVDHGGPKHSAVQATIELHELCEDAGSDGGGVATDGSATDGSATDAASDGADAAPDAPPDGSTCTASTCTTNNPCLAATCGPTGCVTAPVPDGVACTDRNACTSGDVCVSGTCIGMPVVVPPPSACVVTMCDPVLGVVVTPAADGTPCSIDACTVGSACQSGTCAGGRAVDCSSGQVCVIDGCDPSLGCTHAPRPAGDPAASDNNACNGLETCNGAGGTQPGTPPVIDDGLLCTVDSCDPAFGPTHTPISSCDPTPVQGAAPFEARAALMGRLVTRTGGPVAGARFTVTEAAAPDGNGAVRSDVAVSTASDGSFRIRLTSFPDAQADGAPPVHVLLRVDAAGVLPVFRDAWLHTGTAADLGLIKMIPRDTASTPIGPAGGTASDSANSVQVVIPPGALSSTIDVVITPFAARDELPSPLPSATATMYGFELEPSGTTFSAPITVRVANTRSVPTTLSIPTGYFDSTVGRWEHVGQATWDGSRFSFTTTHFSSFDCNAGRGGDPGVGAGSPPPPGDVCGGACCAPAGGNSAGSDPGGDGDPLSNVGSRAGKNGGAVSQTFRLPTYRVRSEDFGVTLGYDSGLAGGRALGAAPSNYQAITHASHAVPLAGFRLRALSVPAASVDRSVPTVRRPGLCGTQATTSFGQPGGIPLRADIAWAGSTTSQIFTMGPTHTEADFSGFVDLASADGQVPSAGIYTAHVVVNAQSPTTCITSGGTFGVSDEQATANTSIATESAPMATFDYPEFVNHRVSSAYGTGWTVQELERVYRAGDVAYLAKGDGSQEKFRPRAYPHVLQPQGSGLALTRDAITGEVFSVRTSGVIERVDPVTGAATTVLSGLPLSAGVRGAAVARVGASRHFAIALATGLVDVDASGATTTLATRPEAITFRDPCVAARGDLVFYTDAASGTLYRTRLSDPTHAVDSISLASGGDPRLFPRTPVSGVTFADPRGMDFGLDGTLYLADVRRNVVYALSPQLNGEVGPASAVAPAVGNGASSYFAPPGERSPGVKFEIREPLAISTAEDGTLMIGTGYGAAWYDPLAREAEWLVSWGGVDEMLLLPTRGPVSLAALGQNSFLMRNGTENEVAGLIRIDVDRLSSEWEPTRTLTKRSGGALELLDTTHAMVETFDSAGRISARKHRTGELMMGFSYADAQSEKLDRVIDFAGGETSFSYDGAGKLQRITDARGRVTNVTVTSLGDLTQLEKPDLETYRFTYELHRMTQKQVPRGDTTTYSFRADGTVQTLTKPGGQVTTVDAVLSHPPTYDASGKLVRAGSYTDGRGVTHQVEVNGRGAIDKDTYVADGVTRVEQAVYVTSETIADGPPLNPADVGPSNDPGTNRNNRLYRVSHRTVNGIPLGPERRLWDAHYRPRGELLPQSGGYTHHWFYTPDGWLSGEIAVVSALGQAYARDAAGHVTRTYDSNDLHLAPPPVSGQFAEYTYRSDGQLATKTEHAVTTTFTYDDAGATRNALGWTDTLGRSMAYVLDARGNVTQTSDGTATTHATYDVHNRVIETRDALGNATTYGYNAAGCGCSQDSLVTDIHTPDLPAGVEWRMVYDVDGRLASVTDPHSFTESYAYETTGELKKLTDKLARDTSWTHDQLARVASMVDTLGRRHGNLYMVPSSGAWTGPTLMAGSGDSTASPTDLAAALRAGDYQIGQNAYPTHGQPAAISLYRDATFALSFTRLFDRDRRLTTRADRAAFAFDSSSVPSPVPDGTFWQQRNTWNNLTARPVLVGTETVRSDGASQGSSYGQNIYFDDTVANGSGFEQSSETLLRDVAGRVTSLIRRHDAGGPLTSTYTYRADGRMARIVGPDGTRDFTYDSRGLMETQAVLGEGTYHYGYDVMGRPGSLTYPDGHVRMQVYDDLGRLTSRCYAYSGPTERCYTAQYDAVGNPVRMADPEGVDVFEYDALDRLKKVTRVASGITTVEDYAYNALGALKVNAGITLDDQRPKLAGGGTADAAVPANVGGLPVVLDAGGRVTSLRGTTFGWNRDGTLREVDEPVPAVAETYGVDARGRRYSRMLGGVVQEYYAYEGQDRVAAVGRNGADPITGFGVAGPVLESYLFDGIDHPLRIKQGATTAYYELDLAGNVRGLRASGGASLGGYRYSAFGQTLEDTSSITQPLRWKGRWFSPVAGGTYDVRARQWSPELGIFLSVDEFRYMSSRGTLWGWPGQNPIRYRDPSGRYASGAIAAGVAVGLGGPIVFFGGSAALAAAGLWSAFHPGDPGGATSGTGPGGGGSGGGIAPAPAPGPSPGGDSGGGPAPGSGGGSGGGYRDPAPPGPQYPECAGQAGFTATEKCCRQATGFRTPSDSCSPNDPGKQNFDDCMSENGF